MNSSLISVVFLIVSLLCIQPAAIIISKISKMINSSEIITHKLIIRTFFTISPSLLLIAFLVTDGYFLTTENWTVFRMISIGASTNLILTTYMSISNKNCKIIEGKIQSGEISEKLALKIYMNSKENVKKSFIELFFMLIAFLSLLAEILVVLLAFEYFVGKIFAYILSPIFLITFTITLVLKDTSTKKHVFIKYIFKKIAKEFKIDYKYGTYSQNWSDNLEIQCDDLKIRINSMIDGNDNSSFDAFKKEVLENEKLSKHDKYFLIKKLKKC